jgi:hypothetical protein
MGVVLRWGGYFTVTAILQYRIGHQVMLRGWVGGGFREHPRRGVPSGALVNCKEVKK